MLHTKSLIRRLTHVPWLLTAGLVLGWVGVEEAMAQDAQAITLTIDKYEVSEAAAGTDGKSVDIKVTATVPANAAGDIRIGLDFRSEVAPTGAVDQPSGGLLTGTDKVGLGTRFRLEGMTDPILIKEGEKKGEATIKIFPVNDALAAQATPRTPADDGDLYIGFIDSYVQGSTGTVAHTTTTLRFVEDDKLATRLTFSPDMMEVSNESDEITIKVTALLNGKALGSEVEFDFRNIAVFDDVTDPVSVDFESYLEGELARKFRRDPGALTTALAVRIRWRRAMWIMLRVAVLAR